jgi:hypothetical protein
MQPTCADYHLKNGTPDKKLNILLKNTKIISVNKRNLLSLMSELFLQH